MRGTGGYEEGRLGEMRVPGRDGGARGRRGGQGEMRELGEDVGAGGDEGARGI